MAGNHGVGSSTRTYWVTWAVLLALTILMLIVDSAPLPRAFFLAVVLTAMLAKAGVIGANFMHLRFERWSLVVMVVVGLLVTGGFLFLLIAPDAMRIRAMGP